MIRLENVTKFYPTPRGRKYVLRDVSVTFPECNIGIFGRNGTGKSTLLRLLGKIDYPTSGRIVVDRSISWPMGLAGGFQGSLTGRDNARFVCRIYGNTDRDIRKKIDFIHEWSELGDYFDMPVKTYSSGMKARLSFATSMAFDFDLYLLDEITAVGDQRFKEKSKAALEEKKGKAQFIKVSHNLKELVRDCDVGILLHDGGMEVYHDIEKALEAHQANQRKR